MRRTASRRAARPLRESDRRKPFTIQTVTRDSGYWQGSGICAWSWAQARGPETGASAEGRRQEERQAWRIAYPRATAPISPGAPRVPPPPPPQSPKRKMPGGWGRASSLTALIVYLIANLVLSFFNEGDEPTISYTEFSKQVANDNVTKIYAKGDAIQGQLKQLSSPPRTTAAARPTTTRSSRRSARPSPTTTSGRTWRSTTSP